MAKSKKKSTRRENGEGSIYEIRNGRNIRYGAAVSFGKKEDGTRDRKVITGKSKEVVIEKMKAFLVQNALIETTDTVEEEKPKIIVNCYSMVEDFVKEFKLQSLMCDPDISSRTFENYSYSLKYFEDFFHGKTVGSVNKNEIKRFFKYMEEARKENDNSLYAYSKATIDRVAYIVKRMFIRAYKEKYITVNPFDELTKFKPKSKQEKKEVLSLTPEEVHESFEVLKNSQLLYPVIGLMINTGVRPQEVLGLRWKNVDLENGIIHVRNAITTWVDFDEDGKRLSSHTVLGTTKRDTGDRDIYISDKMICAIKKWKNVAPEISKTAFDDDDFVFGNTRGKHWSYSGYRNAVNDYLVAHSKDMSSLRLHRIRHTVATLLAEDEASIQYIAQLLGHRKVQTTQKYIDRNSKKIGEKTCDRLDKCITEKFGGFI